MENFFRRLLGKSWRTSLLAYVGLSILLTTVVLLTMGDITAPEMLSLWGGLGGILAIIHAYLGKDARATHSNKLDK